MTPSPRSHFFLSKPPAGYRGIYGSASTVRIGDIVGIAKKVLKGD